MIAARLAPFVMRLTRDRSGVSILEFALSLPVFLGFVLTGIEFSNFVIANNRTQRLATMATDLVAQSGAGAIGAGEGQVYDLFSALDLTAKPFDMRKRGRIVITSIKGVENSSNVVENKIIWQRFDGDYIAAAPTVGCNETTTIATLPAARQLPADEVMFHTQVTYQYQPIFTSRIFSMLTIPTTITRYAMFRARSKDFESPTPDPKFPPKKKCTTTDGL